MCSCVEGEEEMVMPLLELSSLSTGIKISIPDPTCKENQKTHGDEMNIVRKQLNLLSLSLQCLPLPSAFRFSISPWSNLANNKSVACW
jgi:hypothetical protein